MGEFIERLIPKLIGIKFIKELSVSDIFNWVLAFIGGIIVYKIVDNMQTNMERHSIIKDVETTINELFSNEIALSNSDRGGQNIDSVSFRTILHDKSPWNKYKSDNISVMNGKRYIKIRENDELVEYTSTQALHEMLIIFRRIEKLYKDSILKPVDLADMWREILPFATSGRIEFFESYFGYEDIEPITFVIYNTAFACYKDKKKIAINYLRENLNKNRNTCKAFQTNSRYRFREKLKLRKFNKIIYGHEVV